MLGEVVFEELRQDCIICSIGQPIEGGEAANTILRDLFTFWRLRQH